MTIDKALGDTFDAELRKQGVTKVEKVSIDERLRRIAEVVKMSAELFESAPMFAPQGKALSDCAEVLEDIRQELKCKADVDKATPKGQK